MRTRMIPWAGLALAWLAATADAQTEARAPEAVAPASTEDARPVGEVQEPTRSDMKRLLRAHRQDMVQARTEVRKDHEAIRSARGGEARGDRRARLRRRLAALVRHRDRRDEARLELRDQGRRDDARRDLRDQGRRDDARRDLRDQGRRDDARRNRGRARDARRKDRRGHERAHPGARRREGSLRPEREPRRVRARREPRAERPPHRGRLHDV